MANAPYLQGSGSLPEAIALTLRGIQTDLYGEILGGHKALFDFIQSGLTGKPTPGVQLPNLVEGGSAATVVTGFANVGNIETVKGLDFGVTNWSLANGENVELPSVFNLRNLGSEPSVVISLWLTQRTAASAISALIGHAYQNSTYAQWYVGNLTNGDIQVRVNGFGAGGITFTPTEDAPFMLTIHINRTGSGTFEWSLYVNGAKQGATQTLGGTYPFIDPTNGYADAVPALGGLFGFSGTWIGTVHRVQLIKVPQDFDIATWLDTELAANAGRFDV